MHKKKKMHISKQKQKGQRFNALKKHLRGRKLLIRLFVFFVLSVLFVRVKFSCKIKNNKNKEV